MLRRIGRVLTAVFSFIWRLLGRMGLAFRKILTWCVWLPLFYITMPLWLPLNWMREEFIPPLWEFTGAVGVSVRNLVRRLIIHPLQKWIIRPVRGYYRHFLRPFLGTIWRIVSRPFFALGQAIWRRTAVRRTLWRRRAHSRWLVFRANFRLKLKRNSIPEKVEIAPKAPRMAVNKTRHVRLATAVATVALLLAIGLLSWQAQASDTPIAAEAEPITIILTPTPLPPTATPVPTVAIRLTPWATPDPTVGGGAIAFAQTVKGNSDIYLLPVGQTEPVRMTSHAAPDRDPVWSPDGSRIAFSSRRDGNWEIYVYDIPNGRLRRVTRSPDYDAAPTWSPDGQWLAFESYRQENFSEPNLDIYLVKADGSDGPYRLTYDPAPDYAPAWSPDGRHMAFTSWRSGNQDIFIQSLDDAEGEFVINVSDSPGIQEDGAAFSPDGRFLAYYEDAAGFPIINAQPLTDAYQLDGDPTGLGHQGAQPAWSPDGKSVVYLHEKNGHYYLIAGSTEAWGITPQVFTADGRLENPSWVAVNFTPDMTESLENIDRVGKEPFLFVEAIARPERDEPPVKLFEMPVNAPSPYLSDQVDQSFLALRSRVIEEAGWDFLGQLDGMFEDIEVKAPPGQSSETWNKAGRAFDLYYREALGLDPQVFVVREDSAGETYWRVFVKTAVQDGSQGEPLKAIHWDFQARTGDDPQYYERGGKPADSVPAGYFIDFTALAEDYGWTRVPANENWRTYFPDIRFWHFENRQDLTWEEAMLQLYTQSELSTHFER